MEKNVEKACRQCDKWLSTQSYARNRRYKIEYVGQLADEGGKICYIFKYSIIPSGWRLGIVSDAEAYSISKNYNPATQTEDAKLTLHYLKRYLEVRDKQDEMMEKYKDYRRGTYKSMSLQEKMDYLDGVQKEFIPIFDEDGMDMDTLVDFWDIQREFAEAPQMFTVENMVALLHMFDDECFEITMMHELARIVCGIAVHYGKEGICFLLEHLDEVPKEGMWHGHVRVMQFLMAGEDYFLLKEAVTRCVQPGREQLLAILSDPLNEDCFDEEKAEELKTLCTAAYPA